MTLIVFKAATDVNQGAPKVNLGVKAITNVNKLEHVQATKRDPNFSILKIDYRKK